MTTTQTTEYRPATQHCRCGTSWRVQMTADRKSIYANADDDDAALDCSGSHGSLATVFDDQPVTEQQLAEHWEWTKVSRGYEQEVRVENLSALDATVEVPHTKEPTMVTTVEHIEALSEAADIAGSVDIRQLHALAILLGEDPVPFAVRLIERIGAYGTPGKHLQYCSMCESALS